jgi:hypothetical protein
MMPSAMTLAAIMIATSSTMPTAVITESSENTMSMTMICATTATERSCSACGRFGGFVSLDFLVYLVGCLSDEEQATENQDEPASRHFEA